MSGAPTINPAKWAELAVLKKGWDGYAGKPLTPEALKALDQVHVVPLPSGGWQLEIFLGDTEVEIEVGSEGKINSIMSDRVDKVDP